MHRTIVVSVRFTPFEYGVIEEHVSGSRFRSLAHWCRVAVNQSVTERMLRPGMPSVDATDVAELTRLCSALNERTAASNKMSAVIIGSFAALSRVGAFAESLVREHDEIEPRTVRGMQKMLVNIRVSDAEYQSWSDAAERTGFPRMSAWCRDVLQGIVGIRGGRPATASIKELRRQLAGAVTNAAQLRMLAERQGGQLPAELERESVALVGVLEAAHRLGATR